MVDCPNPGVIEITKTAGGSTATIRFDHCRDGYVYLSVDFSPRNTGERVAVQGYLKNHGHKGSKPVTRKVVFHDSGQVTGYGSTHNGVRFELKPFDWRVPHDAHVSASYL